jgi:hypothetical protein
MKFVLNRERMQSLVSDMAVFLTHARNGDAPRLKSHVPLETADVITNFQPLLDVFREQTVQRARSYLEDLQRADPRHPVFEAISLLAPMQRETWEVHHTQILAWLLNPSRPHGFGLSMLHRLISETLSKQGLLPVEDLDQLQIRPEFRCHEDYRIDLWVECRLLSQGTHIPLLMALEAKVQAEEQQEQLSHYDQAVSRWQSQHAKNAVVLRIFLTPDARDARSSDENWIPMDYLRLARILWSVGRDRPNAPAYMYLRHYISSIYQDIYGWSTPPDVVGRPYDLFHLFHKSGEALRDS